MRSRRRRYCGFWRKRRRSSRNAVVASLFPVVTFLPSSACRRSPHFTFGVVLGKVVDVVSSEAVDGNVYDVGGMPELLPYQPVENAPAQPEASPYLAELGLLGRARRPAEPTLTPWMSFCMG